MLNQLLDDLRFPIGVLFTIFSLILVTLGLLRPVTLNSTLNLNLDAGLIMGVFGLFMLVSAVLSVKAARAQAQREKK